MNPTPPPDLSILREAREIVRAQPVSEFTAHLRNCADELQEAYDIVKVSLTRDATKNFLARVSRCLIAIENVHGHTPAGPEGGAMPVPKQTAVAGRT